MPQDRFRAGGLFEHRLVPVEPHVGTDEVARDPGEHLVGDELPDEVTAHDRMRGDDLRVEPGHPEARVGQAGEELLRPLVAR